MRFIASQSSAVIMAAGLGSETIHSSIDILLRLNICGVIPHLASSSLKPLWRYVDQEHFLFMGANAKVRKRPLPLRYLAPILPTAMSSLCRMEMGAFLGGVQSGGVEFRTRGMPLVTSRKNPSVYTSSPVIIPSMSVSIASLISFGVIPSIVFPRGSGTIRISHGCPSFT